jgi:pyruvate/2-oxoglutarate dehydrogenase complex dihydrolipoamide acyltransferase (E2) component
VYCIGKIEKRAIVDENDKIIPKHMCTVVLTCDHRYGDAALCKQSIKVIKDFVENPKEFDKSKYPEPMSYRQLHDKKKQEKKTQ